MGKISPGNYFLIDCKRQGRFTQGSINSLSLQTVNSLDKQITGKIATTLGLAFISETETSGEVCFANEPGLRPEFRQSFTATDLLDYIYAVLHNSNKHGEFLKTGIAQIPYPTNTDDFWQLVQTGGKLR
jgi:hypothetical protein